MADVGKIFANLSDFGWIWGGFWWILVDFGGFGPKKVAGGARGAQKVAWEGPGDLSGGPKCENVLFFGAFLGPFWSPNWAQNRPGPFSELLK